MKPEDTTLLRDLLTGQRVLTLSVIVEGEPHASLLPFALSADRSALLVHASELAKHSVALGAEGSYSALIHVPDSAELDPLQVPRVSVFGTVRRVDRSDESYPADEAAFLSRFPSSEMTFSLGGFHLYRLDLAKGRLVGGFARARNVSRGALREAL